VEKGVEAEAGQVAVASQVDITAAAAEREGKGAVAAGVGEVAAMEVRSVTVEVASSEVAMKGEASRVVAV